MILLGWKFKKILSTLIALKRFRLIIEREIYSGHNLVNFDLKEIWYFKTSPPYSHLYTHIEDAVQKPIETYIENLIESCRFVWCGSVYSSLLSC